MTHLNGRHGAALVTGGAGFIGSELVHQLAAMGRRVVVLDSLVNGRRENLEGLPPDRVRLVVGDARDAELVTSLARDVSTVFHLACLGVRHSIHSPRETREVNAGGTLALLDAARRARVARFVQVSTSEVYGTAESVPMSEQHPTRPTTAYGASKLEGETCAREFHATHGLPVAIVRPFNVYGPRGHHEGDSGEVIPRVMLRALAGRPLVVFGDGTQTRDFMEVTDTVRGILLAETVDAAIGQTINLGTGREMSIGALVRMIARIAGRPDPAVVHDIERPADVRRLCADGTLARRVLGFEPRITLEDGLLRLLDWYRGQAVAPATLLEDEVLHNWLPVPAPLPAPLPSAIPAESARHGG